MKTSSMPVSTGHTGHSAQVKMRLLVNGLSLRVTQMGPDFLLLETPVEHPPADARLVLQVDQSERSWAMRLPNGLSASAKRVPVTAIV
jgi:hypothetical protein